jgi:hypothetical protein
VAEDFEPHLYELTAQLEKGVPNPRRRDDHWRVVTHLDDPLHNQRSPHYIVVPRGKLPYGTRPLAVTARDPQGEFADLIATAKPLRGSLPLDALQGPIIAASAGNDFEPRAPRT